MSDLAVVRDFIQALLDPLIHSQLDLNSLVIGSESFLSDSLKASFADAVFRCRMKDQEQECFISILLEHKSKVDPIDFYPNLELLVSWISDTVEEQRSNANYSYSLLPWHQKVGI